MLIHDYLDYWTLRDPERMLITDGTQELTRAEFSARTHRIARLLA